ncbi:MAG: calcium-binding protein [Nitrospiraceae bacterium]
MANSQYLGWNQWDVVGRAAVFSFLDSLKVNPTNQDTAFEGKIHFTGQSLGGGLAQYAAYEYVESHQGLTGFSKSNITLTTFNGFGGVLGLQENSGGYDPAILADIGSNAHFYTEGDLISRLGRDSVTGLGHTGGTSYFLSVGSSQIDPDTGQPFLLNAIDAHRIETGFYPFLLPGVEFEAAVARPIEYLPMQNVQHIAALFGRVLNDQDVSPVESLPRLLAGLIAGLSQGDPTETNALAQAVLTNLHAAGQMSDAWYVGLRRFDWGAIAHSHAFTAPAAAGYGVSLLGAILSDAVEFQIDQHVQLFNTLREWVSSAVPTAESSINSEDRRIQAEMLLALVPGAAIGSRLTSVLQPLALDVNQFAQTLVTAGGNWLHESLVDIRSQGNNLGLNLATLSSELASAVTGVAADIGMSEATVQDYLNTVLIPFIHDTANGYANAVTGFLQDVTGAFDVGRGLNFNDVNLVAQAYAAELEDRRLASPIRAALEDAQAIVQQAGQTVVVQSGFGPNPFNAAGFDPDAAASPVVLLNETVARTFTIYLPYDAAAGGQRVKLGLTGPNADDVRLITANGELAGENGVFALVIPEGHRQLTIGVRMNNDMSTNGTLALSATLVDAVGQATHAGAVEASLGLIGSADRPTGQQPNVVYDRTLTGGPSLNDGITNVLNDQLIGGAGRDIVIAGGGQDALYGGDGDDLLVDVLYGAGEADYLDGGAGNDYMSAGIGDDIAYGGDGNDILLGSSYDPGQLDTNGRDYLDGGSGDDYLWGGASDDVLLGGAEDDILRGDNLPGDVPTALFTENGYTVVPPPSPSAVVMHADGGADLLDGGDGNDILQGDAGNDILIGGQGNDRLYGDNQDEFAINEGEDFLDGGDGDDQLFAAGGNDSLSGGAGIDQLYGDQGDDTLDGGADVDTIVGGDGADVLFGGGGNDRLFGEGLNNPYEASNAGGADLLDGGDGDDELQGGVGDDLLFGGAGADLLFGQDGDDSLFGDDGNDQLQGGLGEDLLYGDAGSDSLFGQEDDDMLSGDDGDDLLNGGLGNDELDGGAGSDDVQGREGDDLLLGGNENDFLYGDGADPTMLNLIGGNDWLDGEEGDDQLWGGAGQDRLFGGDGADQLVGDIGDDQLFGEAGNDSLFGDTPFFANQAGADILDGGDGNDLLQGGGGDDRLEGGDGDDALYGELASDPVAAAGNDELHGGAGNDSLIGGRGADRYRFNLGDGIDAIVDTAGEDNRLIFGDGISADSVILEIGANDSLIVRVGNTGDAVHINGFNVNTFTGPHPIDSFEFADGTIMSYSQLAIMRGLQMVGSADADSLHGTSSSDRILAGAGNDIVSGSDGNDSLFGEDGSDVLKGEDGDDLLYGGAGDDQLFGGAGIDVLDGGLGDDLLNAIAGPDRLLGGDGNDTYVLFEAGQEVIELPNAGVDTIKAGLPGSFTLTLPAGVENVELLDDVVALDSRVDFIGNELDNRMIGPNLLDGRQGDDTLIGTGDNTYVFGRGYGQDLIKTGQQFNASPSFLDQIQLLSGITPEDVTLEGQGNNLILKIAGTTDQLAVENYLIEPGLRKPTIGQIVFDDGTVWNTTEIDSRVHLLTGTNDRDNLVGLDNDNELRGLGGDDQIVGSGGNDILDGGAGDDRLSGGDGSDTYLFGRGGGHDAISDSPDSTNGADVDTLLLDEGITPDDIRLQATPELGLSLSINGAADQVTFSSYFYGPLHQIEQIKFADGTTWDSNAISSRIEGLTLVGSDDPDALTGLMTNDTLSGMGGDDILIGEGGNDVLMGGDGNDRLEGKSGTDRLDGGLGADTLLGGTGNDLYIVDDVGDVITESAGQGTDAVESSVTYTLVANVEQLTLTGAAAINGTGNTGNNILTGNGAANVLTGGAGNDTYIVGTGDTVIEQAGSGTDTVQSSASWILGNNVENLTLTGGLAIDGTGNGLNNVIIGNGAANALNGMQGADRMSGGLGDDNYVVDNTGDVVTESLNEGSDTVLSSVTYTLGANVENLTLTGTAAVNGTGNALNNVLTGNSAANRLTGGAGHDTYIVGAGDTVVESSGGGTDTVQSSVTHTLAANVENLTLTGSAAIKGTGNSLNNILVGNNAANTLTGGGGNDTYVVGTGDTVVEAANGGTDAVQSSVTWTLGANVENLMLTGTGSVNGTGNSLANVITGNDAANSLSGGDGNDTLAGGKGNDILNGGPGSDIFQFTRGDGQDIVQDTSGSSDRMQFGTTINPFDLVISRQANDLRLAVHGTGDQVSIQNWYGGAANQTEVIQAGNGQQLMNNQVDQLIQAMAAFTQQSGLSWDQAIDQRPQDVQTILAANWQ